jgi:hypothetical protein
MGKSRYLAGIQPPEGPPVCTALNCLFPGMPPPDVENDRAQGGAHRHLDQAGIVNFTGQGKDLAPLAGGSSLSLVPLPALPQNNRSILEGDPHSVLEAMTVAGYCIGANQGFIYVRAEYPIAVERLELAIEQAREAGLLGKGLFGTDFDFDLSLRFGAGAFVCGEETALLHSVMGQRGEKRIKSDNTVNFAHGNINFLSNICLYLLREVAENLLGFLQDPDQLAPFPGITPDHPVQISKLF